jgi:hypothetical protein
MDVLYFLKERTRLIRDYYEHAARPFNEIIRKIEAEEEPYTPNFSARTQDGKDVFAELQGFANGIGLEQAAPGRYSFLLVLGLFGCFKAGVLNPAKVVHEGRC